MSPTPAELLADREAAWRPALKAVSLIAELELEADDVEPVVHALGRLYGGAERTNDKLRVLAKFPACVATGLAGLGASHYFHGDYWTAVWETAAMDPGQTGQAHWGSAFLTALDKFGLPKFGHLPLKFVGPVLMHAGVPTYSLQDLLRMLARRQQADPQLTGDAFVDWALEPGRATRIHELDKPVQRFLQYGEDYVRDFIDRCLDLLDRLREASPDFDGVRLPARIIARARHLHADGDLDLRLTRRASRSSRSERPRLTLDVFGAGVVVQLPPMGDQPDGTAVWQLIIDGEPVSVRSRSVWPGASETAPATTFALDRPVRTITVGLAGRDSLQYEIDVVDSADPLLIFGDDGRRLPPTAPLPPEPVWLLHPDETVEGERALEVHGDLSVVQEVPAPYGWTGFILRRVDLQRTHAIGLAGGRLRSVRGKTRPRLELAPPVPGVHTMYDNPVYAEPPRVVLPATPEAVTGWSISVRRPDEAKPLVTAEVETSAPIVVDPWKEMTGPFVGPYEITVRGPLGRGLLRSIELVQGLDLEHDPPWRELSGDGLVPGKTKVSVASGVQVAPTAFSLAPREFQAQLEVSGSGCTEVLAIEPPHMAVQALSMSAAAHWTPAPIALAAEEFDEPGALLVMVPDGVRDATLHVVASGELVQSTASDAFSAGHPCRFQLTRIADTVRDLRAVDLQVELVKRRITVARVRPRRLAKGAHVDEEGRLNFVDAPDIGDLFAAVYPIYYPWRDPFVMSVRNAQTDCLPEPVRRAGRLRVLLRVDDPWVPAPWPTWPAGENVFDVDGAPADVGGVDAEDRVARYLAGDCPLQGAAEALPQLLSVYEREAELARAGVRAQVRRDVTQALADASAAGVVAVADSRVTAASATAALVESGLVAAPLSTEFDPETALALWTRSATAAGLLVEPALSAHPELRDAFQERIESVCGDAAEAIVKGQADPYAAVGTFGAAAKQLAGQPREVLDMVWRASRIAPAALLDADSRALAARELFEARSHPRIQAATSGHRTSVQFIEMLLERANLSRSLVALRKRIVPVDVAWQALPAVSLALAFASRLAARGDRLFAMKVEEGRDKHVALARHAPQLTQIDLVLAELTVRADS